MASKPQQLEPGEALPVFEELYQAHYRKVVAYARRRTFSIEDADDVVATVFAVAWRRLEDLAGADEPLAWLYGVAFRTVLNQRRGAKRSGRLTDKIASQPAQSAPAVEPEVEARDRLARVTAAMATLPERDQEILRLVGWEECSHAEIAATLGISRALVRTRLLRARRRLGAAYGDTP